MRGMIEHEAYLQQAAHAQQTKISSVCLENRMSLLAALDVNAIAELIQTSAGLAQFAQRWNGYDRLAPLGVKTQIIPANMRAGVHHQRSQCTEMKSTGLPMREQMMASCLQALQPTEAKPVRTGLARRLLINLETLNINSSGLEDLCCYLYEEPWADLLMSAKNLACSGRSLQRVLQTMGLGFANLRMAIRLNMVGDAIRMSDESLTRIAQSAGFFDAAHMDRSWKQATGISPSQYRKLLT